MTEVQESAAILIDGKQIGAELKEEIGKEVAARVAAGKSRPGLATVLVGDNPGLACLCSNETSCL